MSSADAAARSTRAAAERRRNRETEGPARDSVQDAAQNARFAALTPRNEQPAEPMDGSQEAMERNWTLFHNAILRQIRGLGASANDVKNFHRQIIGHRTPLARLLHGNVSGAIRSNGDKCTFEVSTEVLPFHLAATFALASSIVRKIPVAEMYTQYISKIESILEISTEVALYKADIENEVRAHALRCVRFLGLFYTLLEEDDQNVTFAYKILNDFFLVFLQRLEFHRKIIKQKVKLMELQLFLGDEYSHAQDYSETQVVTGNSRDLDEILPV
jgi:hypothetical protein